MSHLASLGAPLCRALERARSVGVITGAGISAESGIPTYRGPGGIYTDPEIGNRTVEALSEHTLRLDPDRTWRALAELARRARGASPNPAHRALAALETRLAERGGHFVLLTQNVDGLHALAGSRNVIDIHGDLRFARCERCAERVRVDDPGELETAPRCAGCQAALRPDAVLFGETLPLAKLRRIQIELHERVPDVLLAIGTSALFPYIVEPVVRAFRYGSVTLEVNPEPTDLGPCLSAALRGKAGAIVPKLVELIGRSAES